jgi:phosphopantothenoylcysteine synthetase/decarboxylase
MKIVVTCGPAFEPIDEVRRITNFSTGELGIVLANRLVDSGHQVICFRGYGATTLLPLASDAELVVFQTNEDLDAKLRELPDRENVFAVFHAAALCDYRVNSVTDDAGGKISAAKISSRLKVLTVSLVAAKKLLPELRSIFPAAKVVGWKFELNGTREDSVAAAYHQLNTCDTAACVVNGSAYGPGFGFCTVESVAPRHFPDKYLLADFLASWL